MNIEELESIVARQRDNAGYAGVRYSVQICKTENHEITYLVAFYYDYTVHGCGGDRPCGHEESGCKRETVEHLGIHTKALEAILIALRKLKSEGVREDIYP